MGFLDPKALRDWIKSRAVNNLMATAKGFFLDARVGPVIQEKIDEVKEEVNEINGNLVVIENNFGQQGGCITCNKTTREVHVSFALSFGNDTMQSGGLIYTFNSAFAPKIRKSIFGMAVQGDVLSYAQLVIHPNGEMRYHGSVGNASLMFFNGSYIYG